uniref:Uncharacterized protein n=1 Tax=Anguilla anguilla TaxID=7936 RepID=A0A0E9TBB0_ANGAN
MPLYGDRCRQSYMLCSAQTLTFILTCTRAIK